MCTHILYHSEDGRAKLVEHIDAFACVQKRHILRGRDYDCAV